MAVDQAAGQDGKAKAALTKVVRAVIQPGGKDIDWQRVRAVGVVIGALAVLHGLKTRTWRYIHTFGAVLVIVSAGAGRLKAKFGGAAPAPEGK